ncbi:uncharacterized protein A1O9_05365 [Exophiala aquamarina CBS 119918]|uniref:Zn(2)-C6 fungal-type domain-containing protein n=1 Tax=Exophiala aquamarina CBS 119918 TaxID=1182545 RepID=A0A072PDS9_9EURO|nr:uncharacterized protein A1O9_05365 [Exophiala aquamarina CBS 119918]KEF57448.1 hypothetical protein A1O9_05365 [Exophiala aquamarina CBS 119918]
MSETSSSGQFDSQKSAPAPTSAPSATLGTLPRHTVNHRACKECRQQKLRCDLVNAEDAESSNCSRCRKLGLDCRIEETFKRTRKRKRSRDYEQEIEQLKQQLSVQTASPPLLWSTSAPAAAAASLTGPIEGISQEERSGADVPLFKAMTLSTTVPEGVSPGAPDPSIIPGVTTVPLDTSLVSRRLTATLNTGRVVLGHIELSAQDVNELFDLYFLTYHPYLPFLDSATTPQQYLEASPPLFWMIISIAARRLSTNPTLLTGLARSVPDLVWKALQGLPHTLGLIQCLILSCTWPFPVSSTTIDPSYMHVGIMMQAAMQMGLHRPANPEDFTKYHLKLSNGQIAERRRTWIACNIVARLVSMGVGLPTPSPLTNPSLMSLSNLDAMQDHQLDFVLRCTERLHVPDLSSSRDRPTLYAILEHEISQLEANMDAASKYQVLYLLSTKLNLQTWFLFDEPAVPGYAHRIGMLYSTACAMVQHIQPFQEGQFPNDLPSSLPFFCYQSFVCAAFVLLKILKNAYFASILDAASGTKLLNCAIMSLRRISVTNNDLPGRLSDVLAYLWTYPERTLVSGQDIRGLKLKVQSRMSMSIVYDSLWRWREQFQRDQASGVTIEQNNGKNCSISMSLPRILY